MRNRFFACTILLSVSLCHDSFLYAQTNDQLLGIFEGCFTATPNGRATDCIDANLCESRSCYELLSGEWTSYEDALRFYRFACETHDNPIPGIEPIPKGDPPNPADYPILEMSLVDTCATYFAPGFRRIPRVYAICKDWDVSSIGLGRTSCQVWEFQCLRTLFCRKECALDEDLFDMTGQVSIECQENSLDLFGIFDPPNFAKVEGAAFSRTRCSIPRPRRLVGPVIQ